MILELPTMQDWREHLTPPQTPSGSLDGAPVIVHFPLGRLSVHMGQLALAGAQDLSPVGLPFLFVSFVLGVVIVTVVIIVLCASLSFLQGPDSITTRTVWVICTL